MDALEVFDQNEFIQASNRQKESAVDLINLSRIYGFLCVTRYIYGEVLIALRVL